MEITSEYRLEWASEQIVFLAIAGKAGLLQ